MNQEELLALRHSAEHVLTFAMLRLWPGKIKPAMGPATEEGFYFDFDSDLKVSEDDFAKIEKEMAKIIKENLPIIKDELTVEEAEKFFSSGTYKDNEYKHEWIEQIKARGEKVSVYWLGEKGQDIPVTFVDICSGPHVESTGKIGAFKLLKIAGAYWHGDEKNKMLQRIYGTAFESQNELDGYLHMIEEAEKRDHRKIGKEQELFMMHDFAPGMPFFLPNGQVIFNELVKFTREVSYGEGYSEVKTPQIFNAELWKTSGHWDHYQDVMFHFHHEDDDVDFGVKPMNCPGHMLVFKNGLRSYRELPLRLAETTTLYRNEKSGTLHGLTRVRSLSQDDCHIFLREEQILEEISNLLNKIKTIYKLFNLEIDEIHLSTRPESFLGEIEVWNKAEADLAKALETAGLQYKINAGDGAFYGPKIDVKIKDAIGRQWQLATIQLDFQLPGRFGLTYVDADGKEKTPVVIHRALLGSMERFMGVIIEHYAGLWPVWLSPVQILLAPVSEKHNEGAFKLAEELKNFGIRVEVDGAAETLGNKVRKGVGRKIPYIVVVGDKELAGEEWMIRVRGQEKQEKMSKSEFTEKVLSEIKERK